MMHYNLPKLFFECKSNLSCIYYNFNVYKLKINLTKYINIIYYMNIVYNILYIINILQIFFINFVFIKIGVNIVNKNYYLGPRF